MQRLELQTAQAMLSYVDSHDRDTWVEMAMSMKSEFGDEGFGVWDAWSQNAESYNEQAARSVWKSVKRNGSVTIASLIFYAKQAGYKGESLSHEQLMERKPVPTEVDTKAKDDAAKKAKWILRNTTTEKHDYLSRKGFPDMEWAVYKGALVVPMRINQMVVGCQLIKQDGSKIFLRDQQVMGATYEIGNGDIRFFCEGLATGLSVSHALRLSAIRARVVVCFTAGNLAKVAKSSGQGFVVADNDRPHPKKIGGEIVMVNAGIEAAKQTGRPYFHSEVEGNDFNDDWRKSQFAASSALKMFFMLNKNN